MPTINHSCAYCVELLSDRLPAEGMRCTCREEQRAAIGGAVEADPAAMLRAAHEQIRDLRTALAAMTKDRDAQAEAVRKLGRVAAWMRTCLADPMIGSLVVSRHVDGVEKLVPVIEALHTEWIDVMNNPIAAAAVKGGGG